MEQKSVGYVQILWTVMLIRQGLRAYYVEYLYEDNVLIKYGL